jgi:HNH endonuclease
MSRYGMGLSDIDNRRNILLLRKDIHHCFDNRWFVIVPKIATVETGSATPSIRYVVHIISQDAVGFWPIYHNTLVGSLCNNHRAYLFARFAWAIFFRVKLFVIKGRPRYIIRIHKDEEGEIEYKVEHCPGKMLSSEYGGGGSQAATPKKRKSGPDSIANDEENPIESSSEDSDISIDEMDGLWDMMDDWKGRGRKRRQESSDETVPDTKVHLASDVEADLREALRKGMLEQEVEITL